MKHYDDLIDRLRNGTKLPMLAALMREGAEAIEDLDSELNWCRNELCLHCGNYKLKHKGACEGCKWTT